MSAIVSNSAWRFAMVGVLNTAIGYSTILALLFLGVSDFQSNLAGYCVGLGISFFVHRLWTFEQQGAPVLPIAANQIGLYIAAFAVSYGVNLLVLIAGNNLGYAREPLVHLIAMACYTLSFYVLSRYFVFSRKKLPRLPFASVYASIQRRGKNELIVAGSAILLLPFLMPLNLTHDVSWQFWIARQLNNGVPLYSHIVEINPPLWFWMAMPLEQFGTLVGIHPHALYIAAITLMAVISAILFGRLTELSDSSKTLVLMLVTLTMLLLAPLYDLGQREQITAICALPYVALIARRFSGRHTRWQVAIAVGLLAAPGFALKHYFIVVPIALEIWLFTRQRLAWRPLRPETIALGLSAIVYVGSILIYTPEFISKTIPLIQSSYSGYNRHWAHQVFRAEVIIWISAALSAYFLERRPRRRHRRNAVIPALFIAFWGFFFAYVAQQKGWQYHAIPATICISLMLVVSLLDSHRKLSTLRMHVAAIVISLSYILLGLSMGPYFNDRDVSEYYDMMEPDSSVMILTTDPRVIFPHVEDRKLKWTSRNFSHWMLSRVAIDSHLGVKNDQLKSMGAEIRAELVNDINCNEPDHLLIQYRIPQYHIGPDAFSMMEFFSRDPDFTYLLDHHYSLVKQDSVMKVYRKTSRFGSNAEPKCYGVY